MLASGEVNLWTYSKWRAYIYDSKTEQFMKIKETPIDNSTIYLSSPLPAVEIKPINSLLIELMKISLIQQLSDLSKPQQMYIPDSKMEYMMKIKETPIDNSTIYPSSPLPDVEIKPTDSLLIELMKISLTQQLNDLSKPQSTSLSLRHQITQE
jgi:hypothetical protein